MKTKYVSWRRVSTFKQNSSGLGLAAQKEIIKYFIEREGGDWIADFEECYTGTELSGCVELQKAIEFTKKIDGVLIIAKTDRFRNTIEALQVYEKMGDGHIMFCDLPHTDKFTLTLFFALAEREALIVSIRTKQALAEKKRQGCKLGGATEKWQASFEAKSAKEKKEEFAKRGGTKSAHFIDSRDTQAMFRIIKNVYPKAVHDKKGNEIDNPAEWNWLLIKTKVDARESIRRYMKDYKAMDESGKLFAKWDLDNMEDKAFQLKLAALFLSYKRSLFKK